MSLTRAQKSYLAGIVCNCLIEPWNMCRPGRLRSCQRRQQRMCQPGRLRSCQRRQQRRSQPGMKCSLMREHPSMCLLGRWSRWRCIDYWSMCQQDNLHPAISMVWKPARIINWL